MRDLGVGGYRLSIAWPRVQPEGSGRANPEGLAFYDRLVDELLAAGVRPMATLFHWDLPQALEDRGGWLQRDTAERFAEYAALVGAAPRRPGRALVPGQRAQRGDDARPRARRARPRQAADVRRAPGRAPPAARARPGARRAAGRRRERASAPRTTTRRCWRPPTTPADVAAAELYDTLWNRIFSDPILLGRYPAGISELMPGPVEDDLAVISAPVDFYGLNYYNPTRIADPASPLEAEPGMDEVLSARGAPFKMVPLEGYERTAFGWPVVPDGLRETLVGLKTAYGDRLPPVYITESGCAYDDVVGADGAVHDPQRVAYLDAHLRAVARGDRRRGRRTRLLRVVAARQLRVGRGVLQALRPGARRLRDPAPHAQGLLRLVPRPDRRTPVTTLPPPPAAGAGRPARLGAQALGRLGHAGRTRAVGGVLRADPGAARPAGRRWSRPATRSSSSAW